MRKKKITTILIIIIFQMMYFLFAPNIFQKGGVDNIHLILIPLIISIGAIAYLLFIKCKIKFIYFIIGMITGLTATFISLWLTSIYVDAVYLHNPHYLWRTADRVFTNFVSCFVSVLSFSLLSEIYFSLVKSLSIRNVLNKKSGIPFH